MFLWGYRRNGNGIREIILIGNRGSKEQVILREQGPVSKVESVG